MTRRTSVDGRQRQHFPRLFDPTSPQRPDAIAKLSSVRDELIVCDQVLYEIYSVLTRPPHSNGLGRSPTDAMRLVDDVEFFARRVADPPGLKDRWKALCLAHDVRGKPSHDARIAAFTIEIGAAAIATLNPSDFRRFPIVVI